MYLIEELVHLYINSRATPENTKTTRSFSLRISISEEPEVQLSPKHADTKTEHSHLVVDDDSVVSALRGLLIVLALSVHELFEGLAVGLESSVANVWYVASLAYQLAASTIHLNTHMHVKYYYLVDAVGNIIFHYVGFFYY